MRGWPRTLFWRLVLILVAGMCGAQLLTGSVWYQVRHTEAMEIPIRLAAARMADIQRQAQREPERLEALVAVLEHDDFQLQLMPREALDTHAPATQSLLRTSFAEQGGRPEDLTLLHAEMTTVDDEPVGWWALATNTTTRVKLEMALSLSETRTLRVDMEADQGWSSRSVIDGVWDYLLRLYFARIALLMLLALVAVRLAVGPVNRLAEAAHRLGKDIRQPPLPDRGPTEVRRAASAFNTMQQRLVNHLAQRTRFLAAVSHDLRSPITRLRLRTEMLKDETLKASFRRDLESMESMVAATLDTLQQHDLEKAFETTDVGSILHGIQADFGEQGKGFALHGEVRWPIEGHPQSLQRAVVNLVENAFRYASEVAIIIDDNDAQLTICVVDRGPGIADEELERVTEPYYRLEESRNHATGGYGLGLSIVQTVVEAHRGRLTLSNREGGGLAACIELPRHPADVS